VAARRGVHRQQARKASALYPDRRHRLDRSQRPAPQTFNFGLGARVLFTDRVALQVDMRDHVFSTDILGKQQNTQNLELTGGITFFF
jgi:outer membrane beta-barrel protein